MGFGFINPLMKEISMSIKPTIPFVGLLAAIFFAVCSVVLFFSAFATMGTQLLSAFMLSISIFALLLIDHSYMSIDFNGRVLQLSGFFKVRRMKIDINSICGYEIHQRVDEFNSLHNMLVLVLGNGKRVVFPKIAYANYLLIETFFEANIKFMGYRPLRFADFFKKWVPIVTFISGLLALLVALQKLL